MADLANITSALMLRDALVCISSVVPNEDESDTMIAASLVAMDAALAIPATTLSDVRMKLDAIVEDAGCGLVEVEHLAFIIRDLAQIARSVVQ